MYQEIYEAARRGDVDVVKGLIKYCNDPVRYSVESLQFVNCKLNDIDIVTKTILHDFCSSMFSF